MVLGLLLPFAGAFIGSTIGIGSQLGWALGSLISTAFDRPKQFGARIDDLYVPLADYGVDLVRGIGRFPTAGVYVWSSGLIETSSTTTTGGFIFFGGTDVTVYRYFINAHILLHDGAIDGLKRVWADGILIADFDNSADDKIKESTNKFLSFATVFNGSPTQQPDPKLVEWVRKGKQTGGIINPEDCPSYPDESYLALWNYPLKNHNNRIPRWLFENVSSGTSVPPGWETVTPNLIGTTAWGERTSATSVVLKDHMYLLGGFGDTGLQNPSVRTQTGEAGDWENVTLSRLGWTPVSDATAIVYKGALTDTELADSGFESVEEHILLFGGLVGSHDYSSFAGVVGSERRWNIGTAFNGKRGFPITVRESSMGGWYRHGYCIAVWNPPAGNNMGINSSVIVMWGGRETRESDAFYPVQSLGTGGRLKDMWISSNFGMSWELVENPAYTSSPIPANYDIGLHDGTEGAYGLVFNGELYSVGGLSESSPKDDTALRFDVTSGSGIEFVNECNSLSGRILEPILVPKYLIVSTSIAGLMILEGVHGDVTSIFVSGKTFTITGSGGSGLNDGTWKIASSTYSGGQTRITIVGKFLAEENGGSVMYQNSDDHSIMGAVVWRNKMVVFANISGTTKAVSSEDGITWKQFEIVNNLPTAGGSLGDFPTFVEFRGQIYMSGGDDGTGITDRVVRTNLPTVDPGMISMETAMNWICVTQAGIDESKADFANLSTKEIVGLVIPSISPPADVIGSLESLGAWDLIHSEGILKSALRSDDTGETIQQTDLAQFTEGGEQPNYQSITHTMDFELPSKVGVRYIDVDKDMKINEQLSQDVQIDSSGSQVVFNKNYIEVNSNIIMTADQARLNAHHILWNALQEKGTITVSTTLKHLKFEPGDTVTLALPSGNLQVRFQERNFVQKNLIVGTAVIEDVSMWGNVPSNIGGNSFGDVSEGGSSETLIISDTTGHLIDVPCLGKRLWDEYGFFYAAAPSTGNNLSGWTGLLLWFLNDEEKFKVLNETRRAATMGTIADVSSISTVASPLVWDNASAITVTMTFAEEDAYANRSKADVVKDGLNLFVFGNEIGAYSNVSFNSSGNPVFSTLLRGLFNTEGEIDNHANGERFVLLENIRRVSTFPIEGIGVSMDYKFVTEGGQEARVASTAFINNATGKKPYSPVNLRSERKYDGSWIIDWDARSRFETGLSFGEVDSDNDELNFEMEFYNSAFTSILQTRQIIGNTRLTLFPIEQTGSADFGSALQNTLYVRLYAVNPKYPVGSGRSDYIQGTLT